ncbi:hypothetical protein FRC03_007178 [Tulasnella sp. 419]|nr:hypothetical protein FRC03_007178 [Tulasnella sp. 419]
MFTNALTSLSRRSLISRVVKPSLPPSRTFHSSRQLSAVRYVRFGGGGSDKGGWRPRFNQWDRPTKLLAGAVGGGGVYYVYHLERIEETGRWRFIDVSPEREKQLAEESNKEVLAEFGSKILPHNHPEARQVSKVASRILSAANLGEVKGHRGEETLSLGISDLFGNDVWGSPSYGSQAADRLKQEWEVFVIKDDKIPNAFVTPGGKIFVFTGIFPACQNEDGLATVLGHEIAHQVVRHSAEKLSGMKVFGALVLLLEILGLDVGVSRLGLTLFMTLPNSRSMESEADQVGLRLMAQACYDPRESTKLWERMSQLEAQSSGAKWWNFGAKMSDVDFVSTHPANSKRIKALEQWIPSALSIRAGSSCGADMSSKYESFKDTSRTLAMQPRPRWDA